jgi:hypothetical protein
LAHPTPKSINNIISQTKKEWKLYPNPAETFINIQLPFADKLSSIKITNTLGEIVLLKQCANNDCRFDISHLSGGIYNCEVVSTNQKYATKRFVVKR